MKLGAETSVNAKELLVHDRRQWQCAKGIHASLVNLFRVLMLAFQLEGEIIRQMPAFVVTSKEPERIRVPDLQRPQVQHRLFN